VDAEDISHFYTNNLLKNYWISIVFTHPVILRKMILKKKNS
jgi:hypothetical protein